MNNEPPLARFGVLADVQYADVDDLEQYGRVRYYRNSRSLLRSAVNDWKKQNTEFILDLGDLVDAVKSKSYHSDLELVLHEMSLLFDEKSTSQPHTWVIIFSNVNET